MSQNKIIIGVLAALAIIAVAGGVLFFLLKSFQPTATQSPADSNTYSGSGSVNTTQAPQGTIKPGTTSIKNVPSYNLDLQYKQIFVILAADYMEFNELTSSGPQGSIYANYTGDIADSKNLYPNAKQNSIQTAAVDLNSDGVAEAVVSENLAAFCGTSGCPLDIYQKKNGKFVKISNMQSYGAVGIEQGSGTKGYKNLLITVNDEPTGIFQIVRYVWDGARYQPEKVLAGWTGGSFIQIP